MVHALVFRFSALDVELSTLTGIDSRCFCSRQSIKSGDQAATSTNLVARGAAGDSHDAQTSPRVTRFDGTGLVMIDQPRLRC